MVKLNVITPDVYQSRGFGATFNVLYFDLFRHRWFGHIIFAPTWLNAWMTSWVLCVHTMHETLPSIERHLSRWDGTCSITICISMWNFRSSKGIFFVWNLNKWWRGIKICTFKVQHFEFIEHNFFVKWIFKWVCCFTSFFPKEFKVLRVLYGLIFYRVRPLIKILLFVICHHMIVCN
jgi:hypothetical protein